MTSSSGSERVAAPPDSSWVVALYREPTGGEALGAGVFIGDGRALVSGHVATEALVDAGLWVAFPKAAPASLERRAVLNVERPDNVDVFDAAVVRWDGGVPPSVRAAPLRCPAGAALVGRRWWAFGFPGGYRFGSVASGRVGDELAHGWVRLVSCR